MRYVEITEAVRPAMLYHGTSLNALLSIISSDSLSGADASGPYGASLTRDPRLARNFARRSADVVQYVAINVAHNPAAEADYRANWLGEWAEWKVDPEHGAGGAVIAFDQAILRTKFRIEPFAEEGLDDEFEERLIIRGYGSAKGVIRAITRIDIINPPAYAKFKQLVLSVDPDWGPTFAKIEHLTAG